MRLTVRRAKISKDLREHFALYGTEVVALALGLGTVQGSGLGTAPVMPTNALMIVHGNQQAASEWLREQRDKRECYEFLMTALTIIAAVAASIAAWPVVKP